MPRGPDLSYGQAAVEALMWTPDGEETTAECSITYDTDGRASDVLDAAGRLQPPAPPPVVYAGPCLFRPLATADRVVNEGGETTQLTRYKLTLPLSAVALLAGARVTVTKNVRLPATVGQHFRIIEPMHRVLAVAAGYLCELRAVPSDRP